MPMTLEGWAFATQKLRQMKNAASGRRFSLYKMPCTRHQQCDHGTCPSGGLKKGQGLGLQAGAAHRRQALPDTLAIWFIDQARIADHQHTAIRLVADQAPGALLQFDRGMRYLIVHEGIAAG